MFFQETNSKVLLPKITEIDFNKGVDGFPFRLTENGALAVQLARFEQQRQNEMDLGKDASLRDRSLRPAASQCLQMLAMSFTDGVGDELSGLARNVVDAPAAELFLLQLAHIRDARRRQIDAALTGTCREHALALLDLSIAARAVPALTAVLLRLRQQAFLESVIVCSARRFGWRRRAA